MNYIRFKTILRDSIRHFKKICTHKRMVFHYCRMCNIPILGLLHDLSKYSPTEFFESIKYYQGDKSPIDICKKQNGYSLAWLHHKGRNKHHFEYWIDEFLNSENKTEIRPICMPYKYAVEMLCDYLGAGKAYNGSNFTYFNEYLWWLNKLEQNIPMNNSNKYFLTHVFYKLAYNELVDHLNEKEILNEIELSALYKLSLLNTSDSNLKELIEYANGTMFTRAMQKGLMK